MENDDVSKFIQEYIEVVDTDTTYDSDVTIDIGNISWTISDSDISFNIVPEDTSPEIYTSHEQRDQHEKYPALKKAWEDYLSMYNLTKGDPPIVD